MQPYKEEILKLDPNAEVEIWPDVAHRERVTFAVAWKHPEGVLDRYPNLKAVSSLGAGVEHLLRDESIPDGVILTRIVPPSLISDMSDYLVSALLNLVNHTYEFADNQRRAVWEPLLAVPKRSLTVGVMGLGEIGRQCALDIARMGFPVVGLSRTKKEIEGVETFSMSTWEKGDGLQENDHVDGLDAFLARTNVLVSLLPLTDQTRDIMDLEVFKKLRKPAYVINVGRGLQLVDEDLIYALHAGVLEGAVLDVFREEPLPESHPFWSNRKVVVTPHIASVSDPAETAAILLDHYKRVMSGMVPGVVVSEERGY
jgi:glyoxylate/hydroxypyruvate reductase A